MRRNTPKYPYEDVGEIVSIFLRGRKWYANFQRDGRQHRPSLGTTSKKEARRRAIQIEVEIIEGRYKPAAPSPSLAMVAENYRDFLRTEGRAKKTLVKYHKILERLLELADRRGVRKLADVDLKFVDAYRAERVEAGVASKTLFTETVVVRQLVNFALSRGLISIDPLKGLRLKKPKPTPQPCWTPAEVGRIIAHSPKSERLKFLILAETGIRVGELRYLTWDDVDFERNLLHVRPKEGWQPKTGDQRAIPMSTVLRKELEGLPRRSRWVVTAAASRAYPEGDRQTSERRLLTSLKRVLKHLGLPGHLHTFRHAFISGALSSGVPEAIVRGWVGHVDRDVIKLYTHIADAASQAAMRRLTGSNDKHRMEGATDATRHADGDSVHFQHNCKEQHDA